MVERHEIYVALLNGGTEVWRPVAAERLGPELFRLMGPVPADETWAFQPGEVVVCRECGFASGARGLIAVAACPT